MKPALSQISRRRARKGGFSLVELVITMTIMTILVGVVSMRANGMTDKARAAKIVSTVEGLRTPVMMYHQDTNQLPYEYSGYQGGTYHRLSLDPGVANWDGPYIETPISRSWNPTGELIHMYNQAIPSYSGNNGFDIDGDGTQDVDQYDATTLVIWGIEEGVAEKVDRAFDSNLGGTWTDAGRVEYTAASRRMNIMIYNR